MTADLHQPQKAISLSHRCRKTRLLLHLRWFSCFDQVSSLQATLEYWRPQDEFILLIMDVLERAYWLNVCLRHTHTQTAQIVAYCFWFYLIFGMSLLSALSFSFFLSRRYKNIHIHFTWSTWQWIISKSPIVPCRLSSLKTFSLSERSMKCNLWPSPPIRVKHEKIPPVAGWKCRARDKLFFCSL